MDEKRVLIVSTVPATIGSFNMDNIHCLLENGYKVDIATNFLDSSAWPSSRVELFKDSVNELGVGCIHLDFSRNPLDIKSHLTAYRSAVKLLSENRYNFIHTHTPIASAIIRLAAQKEKTTVIYTAHGFHFYKGAPLKNWLLYYPIEKYLAKYTDVLITINLEDHDRALRRLHPKRNVYIPGVGIDLSKFKPDKNGRTKVREELGLNSDQIMLLSVGELNENKNHAAVIKAIKGLNLTYVIVGQGHLSEQLQSLAIENQVDLRLLGYRTDVVDIYNAADIYILPSIREGLNVSIMEAMATGLPVACSKIRGNVDLIKAPLFNPSNIDEIRKSIIYAMNNRELLGIENRKNVIPFGLQIVREKTFNVYQSI